MPEETQPVQQCLFCAIDKGQMPSYKVYEDDHVVAVLDIKPANLGHLLVIPKIHYTYITEMTVQEMSHLMNVSRTLIPVLMKVLDVKGVNLLYSAGPAAGQRTPHLYINLIPRSDNDGIALSWKSKEISETQFKDIQQKMINTIGSFKETQSEAPQNPPPSEKNLEEKGVEDEFTSAPGEEDPYYDISDSPAKYW